MIETKNLDIVEGRERIINDEDILNLRIELNRTDWNFNTFIERI